MRHKTATHKEGFGFFAATMMLVATSMLTICCHHHDDKIPTPDNPPKGETPTTKPEPVNDSEAGTFMVANISTGQEVTGNSYECFVGDTLKVQFRPKKEFESVPFEVNAEPFIKLNDSLFVVTDLGTSQGNGVFASKDISIQANYERNDSTLSAMRSLSMITYVEEANITYTISISPDLLPLVDVTLDYTKDEGTVQAKQISESDWTWETDYWYVFTNDANGGTMESTNKEPKNGYTLTDSIPVYTIYYRLNMHYDKLDADHIVRASYKPKSVIDLAAESYELEHFLIWGPADIAGVTVNTFSLDIGSGNEVKRDDVEAYLEHLAANPDVLTLHLDKRYRSITKKE